jgi:hypothetical protein
VILQYRVGQKNNSEAQHGVPLELIEKSKNIEQTFCPKLMFTDQKQKKKIEG